MQSHLLKTFTVSFDLNEDRIRLDCSLVIKNQAKIYFTNKLSKIFINELVNQINKITHVKNSHDIVHGFAVGSRDAQEPVVITSEDTKKWLTKSIDFIRLEKVTRIIFKDNETNAVHLEGDETLLRNILDIFYLTFRTAGWNTDIFPSWVDNVNTANSKSIVVH